MNRRILPIFLLLALAVSMFVGLPSTDAAAIPNADHVYTATIGTPETVDPHWAYDTASGGIIQNIYEPLCSFDGLETGKFLASVADDWPGYGNPGNVIIASDPDPAAPVGTVETWYFHIRENMPWQDPAYGDVNASDAEYSFERGMLFDHTNGPMWMLYEPLTGLDVSYEWDLDASGTLEESEYQTLDAVIDGAIESNATHVWFNLYQAYSPFQQILSQTWSMVMCKEWCIDQGLWNGQRNNYTEFLRTWDPASPGPLMNPAKAMGSGPYTLAVMDEDPNTGYYTHALFANYWDGWTANNCTYVTVKSVNEWSNRKAQFLSSDAALQADFCVIPRANAPELHVDGSLANAVLPGFRLIIPGAPAQYLDAFYYTYEIAVGSPYIPSIGVTPNRFLFKDRNFRLACNYLFDFDIFINDVYLGEAVQSPVCMPNGTLYWNGTKTMYARNTVTANAYMTALNLTTGILAQGLTMDFVYNIGNTARESACRILADALRDDIDWGPSAVVDIDSVGIPWATYLPLLREKKLPLFSIGWLADFPDPHNWFQPFMSPTGTYSSRQVVTYGLDLSTMNWAPNRMFGPVPYLNYKGQLVNALNNTYIGDLISTGVTIPNDLNSTVDPTQLERERLYNELMDIYYAEASQLPTVSALGRHYEKIWIHGWGGTFNENPIAPGNYYRTIYKKADVPLKDVNAATYTATYSPESNITKWLVSQPYHAGGGGLTPPPTNHSWIKLDPTGATTPIASPTAKVQRTDTQTGAIIVYVTWSGVTASGHREEFGYDYELFPASDPTPVDLGPENISDVAPAVGNYTMWFSTYVLSEWGFNINMTKDFDSGIFTMLGYCDVNKDNVVDAKEYQMVKKSVGAVQGGTKWRFTADVNCNGAITVTDYQLIKINIPTVYIPA